MNVLLINISCMGEDNILFFLHICCDGILDQDFFQSLCLKMSAKIVIQTFTHLMGSFSAFLKF